MEKRSQRLKEKHELQEEELEEKVSGKAAAGGQCWPSRQTNSCLIDSPCCDNKQHTTNQKYNPINMAFEQTAVFPASRSAALSYFFLHKPIL